MVVINLRALYWIFSSVLVLDALHKYYASGQTLKLDLTSYNFSSQCIKMVFHYKKDWL